MTQEIQVLPNNYAEVVAFAGDRVRCWDARGVWIITPTRDLFASYGDTLAWDGYGEIEIIPPRGSFAA